MGLGSEEYYAAVDYYRNIMMPGDVLVLKQWVKKKASPIAKEHLQKYCRTAKELEEFFRENSHYFFVENRRVGLYNEELEMAPDMAERYFKEVLKNYNFAVHFMTLKKRHLAHAPDIVRELFQRFYPAKEFEVFFKTRPDVFTVDKDHRVFLIETECVAFLKKRLRYFGRNNVRFTDVRGHVSQAPLHIQRFLNRNYSGFDFQIFLRKNSDVFCISEDGFVSLVSDN